MDKQDQQDMRRLLAPSPLCPLCSLWLIRSLSALLGDLCERQFLIR